MTQHHPVFLDQGLLRKILQGRILESWTCSAYTFILTLGLQGGLKRRFRYPCYLLTALAVNETGAD